MSYPQTHILTGDFVYSILAATGGTMFALGIKPTVFRADNGTIIPHDPVFKYDVTGTGNREELQYHIMHNGKQLLWCVHYCLGNIMMTGFETAQQALLAFEAYLNRKPQ